jgi:hypothetical protein
MGSWLPQGEIDQIGKYTADEGIQVPHFQRWEIHINTHAYVYTHIKMCISNET